MPLLTVTRFFAYLCFTPSKSSLSGSAEDPAYPDTGLSRLAVAVICFLHMVGFLVEAVLQNLDTVTGPNVWGHSFLHAITHALLMVPTTIFLVRTFVSQCRYMFAMSGETLQDSCLSPSTFQRNVCCTSVSAPACSTASDVTLARRILLTQDLAGQLSFSGTSTEGGLG